MKPRSFLKMISSGPDTSSVVNYSKRFSLTQMTGTFSSRVKEGISSVSDTDGFTSSDEDHDELRKRQAVDPGLFTVPYQDQLTGLTRYAPMAQQPGTAITARAASAQFPTSIFSIATGYLPLPTFQTTITPAPTPYAVSIENTVSSPSTLIRRPITEYCLF
jgi:Yeast cell wall synthesis protein KRE9/KNH1